MARLIDEIKWNLHLIKSDILFYYGIKNGLILPYDNRLIENLRNTYYGGLPASILLLHSNLSNGHCYDRGTLITLGFEEDDFKVVNANINNLRLNPKYIDQYRNGKLSEDYSNHCFAERTKNDGTIWVYDTSIGLVFEKNLYYKIEKPKITKINDKEATLDFLYHDFQKDSDIERDKYTLPLILPNIESYINPTQTFYLEQLAEEIEILKHKIDYNGICKEYKEDMKAKILSTREANKM